MKIDTNPEKIKEILSRGIQRIYPSREALEKVLLSGKKLRIYNGIDPTGKLHIGHGVVLKKLRQFQNLGHEVIVLIGDFTARIGDPTGKLSTRKKLTQKQVKKNAAGYKKLIGKILDLKKSNIQFLHNEEWTNKLKPEDMLELASYFTVSRLLERDMFQRRIKEGKEIYVHEFLYPIFQAYDSVTMDVDMEIGGNDQTFNMLAGRTLMRKVKNKEKFVLSTKLLVDPTGRKMGKTEGNMIILDDKPTEMYGKIMSWPDEQIVPAFELLTDLPEKEIKNISRQLKDKNVNPRDIKARLALEIVTLYHGKTSAIKAGDEFNRIFRKKETPTAMPTITLKEKVLNVIDLLMKTKLVISKSEARRLIEQGGVKIEGKIKTDWRENIPINKGMTIQIGKRRFAKII